MAINQYVKRVFSGQLFQDGLYDDTQDYDKPNCSVDASKIKYKDCLFDFQRLQENNAKQIKMALTNNNPVIVGMNVFDRGKGNNLNSRFLDSNGVVKMENFINKILEKFLY